ncbi:mechanosensitive ion channel family protein [Glaciecola sp. 1036]|uniref:mechanosensitive ion channel family protein n=1 Tax=Alteromonadaceae TaxID=72275 RepID=UPI003D0698D2
MPLDQTTDALFVDMNNMMANLLERLPSIGVGLVCFLVLFFLAGPISRFLIKPIDYLSKSELIRIVTRRATSFFVIMVGVYIFLRLAGLTEFAIALISGTGLLGLIVGFAFKDIAENFISSILLSVQKPFKIGDVVDVAGHTGVIHQVTARATTLVDFDGNHIQIPNATIYKNVIKNFSANPKMRGHFIIGIGYESQVLSAQAIAMDVMANHPAVLADPEPQVLLDNLGSSCINLKLYYWINSEQHSLLKVSSILMRTVMRAFESNGISMPDDVRERIFPDGINVRLVKDDEFAEVGVEPQKEAPKLDEPQEQILDFEQHLDDTESDANDIRKQAAQARSPEQGDNIL